MFEVGDRVKFMKPLLVAHGDERTGLIGRVVPLPERRRAYQNKVAGLIPVRFPESNNLWYLKPEDLEKVIS